ncbi:MAG: PadR family transcriptional regulator [Deltaproteobacteria bacterium]|nr:PadR family transcriptional regulator [Deltaproteobacteria bacterium]MBW2117824.1 PadR family transcriptional regulator [Deltaproteobacteria bacterium]MBW2344895.1 PadR family transcriptional regulator [Deltaproteobacteria bacterium]
MKNRLHTEYVLLGALFQGPKHGYEIMHFLDSALQSTWQVSSSQLYVLLKRLESQGLLKCSLKIQKTRPAKRVFTLTPVGKKGFLEWLRSPVEHVRDLRIEFIAKLFFFHRLSVKGGRDLIKIQIESLEELEKKFKKGRDKENDPFKKLVFGIKIITIEAWLKWLIEQATPFIGKAY